MPSALENARLSFGADLAVGVTFGIYVTLATICIYFLLQRQNKSLSHRIILWYTVTMLITGTTWFVSGAWYSELELVEFSSVIGQFNDGDVLYARLNVIHTVFYIVNIFLADSLLVYRVFIIWGRSVLIVVVPAIAWLGVVASGIAAAVITSQPQASFQVSSVIHIKTAFFCLSVSLNVMCTLLITGRLLHQQRITKRLGFVDQKTYTPIIIIVAESAALYSIFGIINIPLLVLQSPIQFVFNSILGTLTLIAPNLIILRVALESTVTHPATRKAATTLQFRKFGGSGSDTVPVSRTIQSVGSQPSDGDNSHACTTAIDIGEGRSAERLLQDGEKVAVMV